ncbi:MAG: ATP-binding protein, partial [Zoogloea sp.]|nr:ATP-binding protein [Zoogloea sp.]
VEAEAGLPGIWADPARIVQVARNLLSNAAKFSPEEKCVTIRLKTVILPPLPGCGGAYRPAVEWIVSDQGVGIPQGEFEAVFDKFVQSTRTRTGAGGTGLGLAICKEIVELHQGSIHARNNPDGGAEFVIVLPLRPQAVVPAAGTVATTGESA